MQHQVAAGPRQTPAAESLSAALPLYAASLVITLAGVGAVGVTITSSIWTPAWAFLTILGHAASLVLRRARLSAESVFYPVMFLGTVLVAQQFATGGALSGAEMGGLSVDMGTAAIVGCLAVVRTFTLVTNASLLFSPVPAITMLALVGSSNPNAEVPLFFGLFVLASLFMMGYEAHLRRAARLRRPPGPVVYHVATAWCVTLVVAAAGFVVSTVLQAVLGPVSPFVLAGASRLRAAVNFTTQANQAPVGQGPIVLSPIPVYEVRAPEGGRLRTAVYNNYSGRAWVADRHPNTAEVYSDRRVEVQPPGFPSRMTLLHYEFAFARDPLVGPDTPVREVRQRIVTRSFTTQGIPGLGRIVGLRYPQSFVTLNLNGTVSGSGHVGPGRTFEVVSEIPEPTPDQLRAAPPVDPDTFEEPATLELPQSTLEVQLLARQVTEGIRNPYERVRAILAHIEKTCQYTLEEEVTPPGEDAAAHYLFNSRRGACDLAATAAAVMCRALQIPARIAVGYVAEEPLEGGGGFMIRQEHGHMWFEAYFPGHGWVPFDAAPPMASIRENPLRLAWYRLRSAFGKIGGGGLDAVLLLAVIASTLALSGLHLAGRLRAHLGEAARERLLWSESPAAAVTVLYHRALRLLERRGWRREPWMTSAEYRDWLLREWEGHPEAAGALVELTGRFEAACYAGEGSADSLARAAAARQALAEKAPRRPRRRDRLPAHPPPAAPAAPPAEAR